MKEWKWFETFNVAWFWTLGQFFDRLIITAHDLTSARRFICAYLERQLYDEWGPPNKVIAEAVTLAIVVTYARPFTTRYDRFGIKERGDLLFLAEGLPEPGLHTWIVSARGARNKAFAHSDAGPRAVRGDGRTSITDDVEPPLERWQAEGLRRNVLWMTELLEPYMKRLHSGM